MELSGYDTVDSLKNFKQGLIMGASYLNKGLDGPKRSDS